MTFADYATAWAYEGSATAKIVFLAVVDHIGADGVGWPSLSRLSSMTGLHRRTVMRALDRLEADGVIARERVCDGRTSTRYRLVAHDPQGPSTPRGTASLNQGHRVTGPGAQSHRTRGTAPPEPIKEPTKEKTKEPKEDRRSILEELEE